MDFINLLLNNYCFIIAATSWLVAGIIKVIIEFILNRTISLKRILGAGGMPSSHTATVVSLAISLGYKEGIDSSIFALAVIFAIIVIHDAVGVRQETGKQAKVLNQMLFDTDVFSDFDLEKHFKEYVGHTPFQVLVGGIVGAVCSFIMINFILKL